MTIILFALVALFSFLLGMNFGKQVLKEKLLVHAHYLINSGEIKIENDNIVIKKNKGEQNE